MYCLFSIYLLPIPRDILCWCFAKPSWQIVAHQSISAISFNFSPPQAVRSSLHLTALKRWCFTPDLHIFTLNPSDLRTTSLSAAHPPLLSPLHNMFPHDFSSIVSPRPLYQLWLKSIWSLNVLFSSTVNFYHSHNHFCAQNLNLFDMAKIFDIFTIGPLRLMRNLTSNLTNLTTELQHFNLLYHSHLERYAWILSKIQFIWYFFDISTLSASLDGQPGW